MVIREATKNDFDQLLELMLELDLDQAELENRKNPNLDEMKQKIARHLEEGFNEPTKRFFVVEADQKLVGFSSTEVSTSMAGIGWIGDMYVKEDHRDKGIGTALMEETIKWLKSQGVTKARLSVHHKNRAISLYEKLGFKEAQSPYKMFEKEMG